MISQEIVTQVLLFLCVLGAAYAVLIRPQLQRMSEHALFLASLKPGDRVVTGGGLIGRIYQINEGGVVTIELGPSLHVQSLASSLASPLQERGSNWSPGPHLKPEGAQRP